MNSLMGKIIGTILVFMLMVVAPLTIWTFSEDLTAKRGILNETTNFLDKVTDTGILSDNQIADFYLGCSSYGFVADVQIFRYMKVVSPDGIGGTVVNYVVADNLTTWNKGDVIKVRVTALDYTGAQRLAMELLHLFTDKLDYTLAGMIRE